MFQTIAYQTVFNNRVIDYAIWLGIILTSVLIIQLAKVIIVGRLKVWAARTSTTIDDFLILHVEKTLFPLLYFGAFYLSVRSLVLTQGIAKGVSVLGMVLVTVFGARFLIQLLSFVLESSWSRTGDGEARGRSIKAIIVIARVVIIGVAGVMLLDNLGVKISALVAGLGIGGVAVALASQAVLGDLFSFFVILFDRPFEVGDFIIIGEYMGAVEHVGIKTTRVRSLSGEQLVFSNTFLTNAQLRNFKRMERRRVVFKLGVTYQTAPEQMKEIPGILAGIVRSTKDTAFDRAHFASYGDFALVYEVVYFVLSSDYNRYMDTQQEINFRIREAFDQRGIEFAYPTQTVFLAKA